MSGGVEAKVRGRIGTLAIDLAFRCSPREVTAIVGPSGAGKTTLLRWLAGLVPLDGALRVDGEAWQEGREVRAAHRRSVGMVFQGTSLLPHLSVRDNIAYAVRRAPAREDVAALIEAAGIGSLLDRRPDTLSGGEAQRAALCRALAARPRLLLLDEPLSALDAEARMDQSAFLARLLPSLDTTTVLVSHDRGEIARLATRVVRVRAGALDGGGV